MQSLFLQKTQSLNPLNSLIYGTTGLVVVVAADAVVVPAADVADVASARSA